VEATFDEQPIAEPGRRRANGNLRSLDAGQARVKQKVITLEAPEAFRAEAETAGKEKQAAQDPPLVRALGLAYYWHRL